MAVPSLLPAPEQLAPRSTEPVERAHHHEVSHGARTDPTASEAIDEVVERGVGPVVLPFLDDGLATFFAEVADVVEADAHGMGVLMRQGWRVFKIHIPWPEVGRLGDDIGQYGGP